MKKTLLMIVREKENEKSRKRKTNTDFETVEVASDAKNVFYFEKQSSNL